MLAKKHNTDKFLVDLTNYESSLSVFDILNGVLSYKDKISPPGRIAVVAPVRQEARKDARFYENACVNRGWIIWKNGEEYDPEIDKKRREENKK